MRFEALFSSTLLTVQSVHCRVCDRALGPEEGAAYSSLVLVQRGAFAIHRGRHCQLVDPLTAAVFRSDDEFRISHPAGCGDITTEFRFCEDIHLRLLGGARDGCRDPSPGLSLPSSAVWAHRGLLARLAGGACEPLEVEEEAIALAGTAAEAGRNGSPDRVRAGTRVRLADMAARAKALVLEAPAQRWTLQGIGRELGVSPCHLTRSFRHVTGEPLYRFLNRARLAIGLDRIAAGEEGLTGLALDLGFSSHAHFTTAFRREYGRTPSAARALLAQ